MGTLFSQSGTCGDNLIWTLTDSVLTISGTGIMTNYSDGLSYAAPWRSYKSSILSVAIEDGVTSIGNCAFYDCSSLTSIEIPNSVIEIGNMAFAYCSNLIDINIPNSITSIRSGTFVNCNSMTSITIPNSVTSIEVGAFQGCRNLTSIEIPNNVTSIGDYAFDGCRMLNSVTIPSSITSIGDHAFYGSGLSIVNISDLAAWCRINFSNETANPLYYAGKLCINGTSITSLVIPEGVINIGEYTFSRASINSIVIPNSVTSIEKYAFYECGLKYVTIPNSVISIGDRVFSGCSDMISVTIGNSVTSIGGWAFSDCSSLTSVTIPNSVTSIGGEAFSGCSSLTSIEIPNSVTSIGSFAFSNCTSLTSIEIPNSVTSIGSFAFSNCTSLTSIEIPNSVTSIGYGAFNGCSGLPVVDDIRYADTYLVGVENKYLTNYLIRDRTRYIGSTAFAGCHNLISIEIPSSVTSIGDNAFSYCSGLTSVSIPNSITSIGSSAFEGCSGLTSVTIGNSVTSIGYGAFEGCSGLTSVTIPNSVTSIGAAAFYNCNGMDSLVFESETPATLGAEPFKYTNNCPLIVPCSAVDAYKTAWPTYVNRISCPGSGSQGITIRLDPQSCADWSVVRLWAWTSGGNLFDAWPGIVVSQDADGWYSYTFDESVESVNIIWTDGTNQTVNIEGVTASTCYALNSTSGKTITASVVDCGSTASNYYTIRFLNWDGTVLQNSQVKEGELPSYTGTTPVRPADEQYTYSFSGWSPVIATATADADYTAQFTATEKTTDPSIPTVQDLATAGYDVANKVVLCLYFDDAPCYDVVIAGTYMADEAGSWITDPEQLVHMAALESFEGWYAAEIPYSSNAQGKPIQLKSNGAFSWEYQSGDADAWIKRGGEGSQTAAIVAGYNNEADVYYPAPGCYIYELAYWKNHNNPCVIIPTHNYTIHLYAPDACEEMKPAIIGNFNNWTTGVAMSETTDEQGKKMYTITIADEEGKAFKFRDAAYDNWSNELQEFLEGYRVWSTFSNFVLPAVTADTTIVFDFSDNSKYRFKLCEKVEDVVVWLKVPTGAPGYYNGAIEMVVYSADEPTAMPLQYNQEDELWSVELQAKGSNYFFVREANSEGNYILNYTHYYYSDGSDEYVWSTWGTTFQYYWEDGTGDFTGSKIIMLDISNPSYYKWDVPAIGTGIEDIQGDDVQCTKVIRNGQIYIIRGDKTYTLQGQEVK